MNSSQSASKKVAFKQIIDARRPCADMTLTCWLSDYSDSGRYGNGSVSDSRDVKGFVTLASRANLEFDRLAFFE